MAAQLHKWPAVRKRLMSPPVSATMLTAPIRSTPGIVSRAANTGSNGTQPPIDLGRQPVQCLVEKVNLRQDLFDEKPMMRTEAAVPSYS
jgi:hypothetical protein